MRYKFSCLKQCSMIMIFCLFFPTAHAAPFAKGDVGVSLVLGSGQAFNDNYNIVGAGIGYYVLDGLRLGISGQTWLGGDVSITKYSPQVQYVMARDEMLKPYLGVFYRKTYIEGLEDIDATGGRAGVYLSGRGNYYISVGIVHEKYLSCNETVYESCSDNYPELSVTFSL